MNPQVRPASAKSVNWRSLQTGQDGPARLKIAKCEAFIGDIDESCHDPGPHVELLDREYLADGETSDPVTERNPRA